MQTVLGKQLKIVGNLPQYVRLPNEVLNAPHIFKIILRFTYANAIQTGDRMQYFDENIAQQC